MNIQINIVIPAATGNVPGVWNLSGTVQYFKVVNLSGQFDVRAGNSQTTMLNPGDGFGNAGSAVYTALTFYNFGGVAIAATVYCGLEPCTLATTAINSTVTATATLSNVLTLCIEAVPRQFCTIGAVGNPVALSAGVTFFRRCLLIAAKSLGGAANGGNISLGFSSVAGQQPIQLSPGDTYLLDMAAVGSKVNFQYLYLAISVAGDGCVAIFS